MELDIAKISTKEQTNKNKFIVNLYDLASVLCVALVTIMLLFTFMFRVVGVVGQSMEPTLYDSDWLIVTAYDYNPEYGDVVIITQPNVFDEPIVKRIIATEFQTVDINFYSGAVYVDGVLLDEAYINNETTNWEGIEFPVEVPEGCVFVMGDNRQHSTDSRSESIGFIDEDYILGEVKLRVFSLDETTGEIKLNSFEDMIVQ